MRWLLLVQQWCFGVSLLTSFVLWSRSGFKFAKSDLHVLVRRCLVQVSSDNRAIFFNMTHKMNVLSMHDQLRDLAYSIVQKEGGTAQCTRLLGGDAEAALKDRVRASKLLQCSVACLRNACDGPQLLAL